MLIYSVTTIITILTNHVRMVLRIMHNRNYRKPRHTHNSVSWGMLPENLDCIIYMLT
jgi:hypothetical protein